MFLLSTRAAASAHSALFFTSNEPIPSDMDAREPPEQLMDDIGSEKRDTAQRVASFSSVL